MASVIRVLYVDDEPDLLDICRMILEKTGDFSVATVDSAHAALDLLGQEQFDAIISDYQMPVMDGIQFLIEVRTKLGRVPFILFTGKGREEVVIEAINNGVDFYLQKGGESQSQFAELAHKVRQAVQRRKAEKEVSEAGERYKTLIRVSNTGAWEYYSDAGFVWCSPEYFSMLGRDVGQFDMSGAANLKEAWNDLLHPDDQERASRNFSEYLLNGSVGMYENKFRMQHDDGHWVWIWSRGWTLRDKDGLLTNKTIGTHIDVTGQMLADEELRKSEEQYRLLIDNSHDIIYTINLEGILTFVSPSWTSLLGHPVDQVIGKPFQQFVHTDDVARCLVSLQGAINTGLGQASVEYRVKHIDGSWQWHNTNAVAIRDASGTIIGVEGIASDITERKWAEEALRQHQAELTMQNEELHMIQEDLIVSREEYQDLYDLAPAGYFTISEKGLILKANLSAATLLSVERATLIKSPLSHFIMPDDQDRYYLHIRRLADTKQRQSFEMRMLHQGGTLFWAQVVVVPAPEGDGEKAAYNLVVIDISERKQAEEDLRVSLVKYKTLFKTFPLGVTVSDPEGRILESNPMAEILLGLPQKEHPRRKIDGEEWRIVRPDGTPMPAGEYASVRALKEKCLVENVEMGIVRRGGEVTWISVTAAPLQLEGYGVVITYGDITGRKVAEEALKKSEEEYRRLVEQSSDGIWLLDKEFLTVYVNPAMEKMLGYSKEEMTGRSWYDFGDPEWVLRAKELEKRRESGIGEPHDFLFIHKDGRNVLTRISTTPLYDNDGSFDGAIGVLSDITMQKQAEEALAKSEDRFRGIFDTITSGVAIYEVKNNAASGRDYIIKDFNRTALELEGKKKEDVVGKSLSDLRPAIDDYGLIPVFRQVWKTGVPGYFPQKIYIDEKYSSWYENRVFRLQSGEIVAVYDDITGRKRSEEALKASEEKYRLMFTTMINGFALLEMMYDESGKPVDCRYVDVNPAHEKLTGLKKEEIVGRTARESIPGLEDYWIENYGRVDQTGTPWYFENYVQGLNRWYGVFVYRTSPGFVAVTFEDITGRRQAEEAVRVSRDLLTKSEADLQVHQVELETQAEELKRAHLELGESRDKYVDLYDFAPISYLTLNDTALIEEVNLAGATLFGMDRKKLVNARFRKFIAQTDSELWDQYFMAVLKTEDKQTCNLMLYRSDGSMFPARLESIRITSSDATPTVRVAVSDITDIRKVEEALRETTEYLENLFAYANAPIIVWNPAFEITRFNHAFEELTGQTEKQVIGKSLEILFPPGSCRDSIDLIKKALAGEKWKVVEIPILNAISGEVKTVIWNSANILSPNGTTVLATIAQGQDITERKRAEEALRQTNKKLTLLSSITRHDINNQLTVQIGYLEILENKQLNPSQNEYFRKVSTAAKRISAMIRFTKEYEQIGVNAPVWQDCRTLVDAAAREAPIGKVMVKNDLPAGTEVFADPLVVKVFYNLVDNAVRYGGKITTIRFSSKNVEDENIIVCEDDGDGIVAADKEKIFGRGFGKNTGLGLTLSQEILSITGITICETGDPGKGARFEMTVPKGMWRLTGDGT